MVAASASVNTNPIKIDTCQFLVEKGGDKGVISLSGHTALGQYRLSKREIADLHAITGKRVCATRDANTLTLEGSTQTMSDVQINAKLEEMLWPPGGPTVKDNDALDEEDED
jgi:hypothetical protein